MSVEVKRIEDVVTTDHLLSARGLRAAYAGRTTDTIAVDDVSLYVNEGEVLGIAGESGCGKSTLAAVLSLTARPPLHVLTGELDVAGKRLSFEPDKAPPRSWRGTVVSLLPQGAMNSLSPTGAGRRLRRPDRAGARGSGQRVRREGAARPSGSPSSTCPSGCSTRTRTSSPAA